MTRVNQSDLVKRLAAEFEIPVTHAKKMVDFLVEQMSEELIKGNMVALHHFGTFRRGEPYDRPNCNFGKSGVTHYKPRIRLVTSIRLRQRL